MVDVNSVVTALGTYALTLVTIVPFLRKYRPVVTNAVQAVEKEGPAIIKAGEEIVHGVEDLLKLPQFAELKLKLDDTERKLKDNELVRVAGIALHGYEKSFNELSATQKGTLVAFVRSSLSKVGYEGTDQSIVRALADAQAFADAFKASDAYKHTAELEQSLKALVEPTAPAPAVTPAPSPEPAPAVNTTVETAQTTS